MRNLDKRPLLSLISPARVCINCRLQRRPFSTTQPPPPKPPSSGFAPLSSRGLISVTGPDAAKFLQGIVTANVVAKDGTSRTEAFYCGFLNATGRILNDVFIYPGFGGEVATEDSSFLIEADSSQIDILAKYIKRYKLRAKLAVRKIDQDEIKIWHAWGDDSDSSALTSLSSPTVNTTTDPRAPGLGHRVLSVGSSPPPILAMAMNQSSEDAYTIQRYLLGVPEGQSEIIRETALPQESNMDYMNGIDYRKGCYIGQELTIRTKHRGVVRKRILPCVIYPKDNSPAPLTLSYDPDAVPAVMAGEIPADTSIGRFGKKGRSAGKWLRGVGNIGLGLCRLEVMTGVQLPGETAAGSWRAEDEFVLEWGGEKDGDSSGGESKGVKVKAFVPEWVKAGLDGK